MFPTRRILPALLTTLLLVAAGHAVADDFRVRVEAEAFGTRIAAEASADAPSLPGQPGVPPGEGNSSLEPAPVVKPGRIDENRTSPGSSEHVIRVHNPGRAPATYEIGWRLPAGWSADASTRSLTVAPNETREFTFVLSAKENATSGKGVLMVGNSRASSSVDLHLRYGEVTRMETRSA